jgi:hypothetical protein
LFYPPRDTLLGGVNFLIRQTITILLLSVLLWTQASLAVRCLHSGNVIPLLVLEGMGQGHCCCAADNSLGICEPSEGMSCYVAAASEFLTFSQLKALSAVSFFVVVLRFPCLQLAKSVSIAALTAASRAPPWQARACQICYLTKRSLLI